MTGRRKDDKPEQAIADEPQTAGRQIRYMAQSVLLEEAGTSWMTTATVFVVAGVVAAFITWSSLTDVDEVAVTNGSVVPAGSVQTVQHLEGGIVREILVRKDQLVQVGQPLLRMDRAQASAEHEQMKARRVSLRLRAERLRAVAEGRSPDFSFVPERQKHLIKDQMEIYQAQVNRWASQRVVFDNQADQKRKEIESANEQIAAVRRQLDLLAKEVKMREELAAKGYTAQVVVFSIKRQYAATESELGRLKGQVRTATEELNEVLSRAEDLDQNVRENALNEMGSVTAELAQVEENLARLNDRVRRLEIRAPVSGFVQGLTVSTVGAVVPAGGVLMDIVPIDGTLLVETKVSTRDIGHVSVGQPVNVKVTSYDFARYGSVGGKLKSISATTLQDEEGGEPFYKGLIELDKSYVGENETANHIMPGMTVQADIVTGKKTFLQYLLKPIYVSMKESFRER